MTLPRPAAVSRLAAPRPVIMLLNLALVVLWSGWFLLQPRWAEFMDWHPGFNAVAPLFFPLMLLTAAAFIGAAFWTTPERVERLGERVQRWRTAYIVGGLLLVCLIGLLAPFTVPTAAWAVVAGASLALLYWQWFAAGPALSRLWLAGGVVFFAVLAFVRIGGLSVHPVVDTVDEPWDYTWVYNYLQTGRFGDILFEGTGVKSSNTPDYYYLASAWYRLVGGELWDLRMLSFLLSLVLIGLIALSIRRVYGPTAAVWAAAWLFASGTMVIATRFRHDIGLALSIALGLWLYVEAVQRERWWLHLLAGLAVGSGVFSHYHTALFGPALGVGLYLPMILARLRQRRPPPAGFWAFCVGGAIMAGVLVLRQPDLFTPAGTGYIGTQFGPSQILGSIARHIFIMTYNSPTELLFIVIATGVMVFGRPTFERPVALALVLCHVILGVESNRNPIYLVPLAPLYTFVIVGAVNAWLERAGAPGWTLRAGHAFTLALFILPLGLGVTQPAFRHVLSGGPLRAEPPPIVAWIRENVEPDEWVVYSHYIYFWLEDYTLRSALIAHYRQLTDPERYPTQQSAFEDVPVDYFLMDPTDRSDEFMGELRTSGWLAQRGYRVIDTVGTIEIWARR